MHNDTKNDSYIGKILFYLVGINFMFLGGLLTMLKQLISVNNLLEMLICFLLAGLGSTVYCMRGVYINYCALKSWDNVWWPWHILRPLIRSILGMMTFISIKALLLMLNASQLNDTVSWFTYVLAFIVGYIPFPRQKN